MSATPKKAILSFEQYRLAKAKQSNPEQVQLVEAVNAYQDKGMGKKAIRARLVLGGKVLGIVVVRFEDIDDCKGQLTPAVIRWKADSDSVATMTEAIEALGCELEPEVRTKEDNGESEVNA